MYHNIGIHDELKSVYERVEKGDFEAYDELIIPLYNILLPFFADKYEKGTLNISFSIEELSSYVYEGVYEYISRVKDNKICYTHEMFGKKYFNMYVNARKCVERFLEKVEDKCKIRPPYIYDSSDNITIEENLETKVLLEEKRSILKSCIARLNAKQQATINAFYNLNNNQKTTIRKLASNLGVSKCRVQQLRDESFETLQEMVCKHPYFKY